MMVPLLQSNTFTDNKSKDVWVDHGWQSPLTTDVNVDIFQSQITSLKKLMIALEKTHEYFFQSSTLCMWKFSVVIKHSWNYLVAYDYKSTKLAIHDVLHCNQMRHYLIKIWNAWYRKIGISGMKHMQRVPSLASNRSTSYSRLVASGQSIVSKPLKVQTWGFSEAWGFLQHRTDSVILLI